MKKVVKRSKSQGKKSSTKKGGSATASRSRATKTSPRRPTTKSGGRSARTGEPAPARRSRTAPPAKLEAPARPEAPPPTPPPAPHRAPIRKVIRDGKVELFERRSETRSDPRTPELEVAWERFTAVAGLAALAPRSLAAFWTDETADLPTLLDRVCGDVAGLPLESLVNHLRETGTPPDAIIDTLHRAASAAIEVPPEVEQRKALRATVTLDPAWRPTQRHYPSQTRALLGLVEWHCKLAAAWPFAFARFMAKIPQTLSSDQFAALASAVDGSSADTARAVGHDEATVLSLIESGRARLRELFEAECADVSRQWNIALRGTGFSPDNLIQRYLVDSLNREFQVLLGKMTIGALGWETSPQFATPALEGMH